ncbi:MAG: signal peptidase II [Streptococcus sp.]|nr:signal peptidase II [Streptococcus sp.]
MNKKNIKKIIVLLIILILIVCDQLVKFYITSNFKLGQVKKFIPKVLSLTYLQNTGAAFSILENQQWFFTIITIIAVGLVGWYLNKHIDRSPWFVGGYSLVIAGGIGNFIDRLHQGFVVDMFQLEFIHFAIFNVADSYLTIGVLILLVLSFKEEVNGTKN